jgi:hypothetical protein
VFVPATSPYHIQKSVLPENIACYSYNTNTEDWVELHFRCGQKGIPGYAIRVTCNKKIPNSKTSTIHLYNESKHTHSISIECENESVSNNI